jgi:hypothetical protein
MPQRVTAAALGASAVLLCGVSLFGDATNCYVPANGPNCVTSMAPLYGWDFGRICHDGDRAFWCRDRVLIGAEQTFPDFDYASPGQSGHTNIMMASKVIKVQTYHCNGSSCTLGNLDIKNCSGPIPNTSSPGCSGT